MSGVLSGERGLRDSRYQEHILRLESSEWMDRFTYLIQKVRSKCLEN